MYGFLWVHFHIVGLHLENLIIKSYIDKYANMSLALFFLDYHGQIVFFKNIMQLFFFLM
jgi:hypothetical protein